MSAGRPSKYTPERVQRIINALAAGNTRGTSAAIGGIDHDTLLRWLRRYTEFADAVKDAEARAEAAHVANIVKAAHSGIWTASAWWLERRRPNAWGKIERIDIIHTVREMAAQAGLDEKETAEAIAEAEGYLKEIQRGAHR